MGYASLILVSLEFRYQRHKAQEYLVDLHLMGYAYLIVGSLGFLIGYEYDFKLGVTLRHASTIKSYVTQCLTDDLGMPSTF